MISPSIDRNNGTADICVVNCLRDTILIPGVATMCPCTDYKKASLLTKWCFV